MFLTFSQRQKQQQQAGQPDVYRYDVTPHPLRNQALHLLRAVLGDDGYAWKDIHDTYRESVGLDAGVSRPADLFRRPTLFYDRCGEMLAKASDEHALDFIEIGFMRVYAIANMKVGRREHRYEIAGANEAIQKLNYRFRQHSVGYQFEIGSIIQVDSQYVHAEIVKPALTLLRGAGFHGAEEEFLHAHQHYRQGNWKAAMDDASKSFESTMKAICTVRKWQFPAHATAIPLVEILLKNGLIPPFLETQIGSLRSAIQNGLPALSNKLSRHGQGKDVEEVFGHTVAFALHLAASNIVFLIEAHNAMPKSGWSAPAAS